MPDYTVGDTIYHHFSTRAFATGIPTTLIGSPVAEAYEDASATGITAGVSLTIDHGETGHHLLTVVATGGNGFETLKTYGVSLTAGTVGGVSVVGEVIFNFTLSRSAAAVNTVDIQTRLPAALSNGMMDANVERWLDTAVNASTSGVPDVNIIRIINSTTAADRLGNWLKSFEQGTAQAGANGSITLAVAESSVTDFFVGGVVFVVSGTGIGQARLITAYDGTTKIATTVPDWATNPASGAVYVIVPGIGTASVEAWLGTAVTLSSTTSLPEVDATSISDDATAADNLELFIEGVALGTLPKVDMDAVDGNTNAANILSRWFRNGQTGTADSGTNATITDSVLSQADDHWNGAMVIIYGGTNQGYSAVVTDFDAASDTATFTPAMPSAIDGTSAYCIVPGLGWSDVQAWLGTAPNALVSGAVDADVSAMQAGVVTAAAIATDAIDADALAADAVDEIWDEAMVETTGAPAVTGSFRAAFQWMFALSRNKITQTATLTTLRNDADGGDLATSVVSDDSTTYVRSEWST